jgi:hypothetical protein
MMLRPVFTPALLLGVLCLTTASARADRVADLAQRLGNRGSSYKVRISAALTLAKMNDDRAITALSRALQKDRAATVRRVAATTLGQRLSKARMTARVRDRAEKVLATAARGDSDPKVRKSALVALSKVRRVAAPRKTHGVWLGIGKATVARRIPKQTGPRLQKSLERALRTHAPGHIKTADHRALPTRAQLSRSGRAGYLVTSQVAELKVKSGRGHRAEVHCTVKMRLAPWSGRDGKERWTAAQTASVSGSARVTSRRDRRSLLAASETCVEAVVEQVTTSKLIPFLAQR